MRTPTAAFRRFAALVPIAAVASDATAQIATGPYTIRLEPVADGLVAPVQAKAAGDGSGRLFIVDQAGTIHILQNGVLLPTPFLDVTSLLVPLFPFYDERGLLGVAFPPNFAASGRFFVHYTIARTGGPTDPCTSDTTFGCSSEVIAEYHVSAANPNVADPASGVVLLTVQKPQFNHAGGAMDFGPDGYLYISLGDGGGANDGLADSPPSHGPTGNAQNLAVPLGKILRFDTSTPGVLAIPPTNPFFGDATKFQGIFAAGFRNPYAFSFDDAPGGTGRFYVGDVGQDAFEEVDIVTLGNNYAWPIKEGFHCFDPFDTHNPPPTCPAADGMTLPITEYPHQDASGPIGLAVVGGHVYRGSRFPGLAGMYLFGDFGTNFNTPDGHLFYLDPEQNPATIFRLRLGDDNHAMNLYVKGIGRDQSHEVYVLASSALGPSGNTGVVFRIAPCLGDFNGDGFVNGMDYDQFNNAFEAGDPSADYNGDGFVDGIDYDQFNNNFEAGC